MQPIVIPCHKGTITLNRTADGHVSMTAQGILMSDMDIKELREALSWLSTGRR